MEEELEPFVRHGTEAERIEIAADEVLAAIAEGRDIDVQYAIISGDLDIRKAAYQLVEVEANEAYEALGAVMNEAVRIATSEEQDADDIDKLVQSLDVVEYIAVHEKKEAGGATAQPQPSQEDRAVLVRSSITVANSEIHGNVYFRAVLFTKGVDFSFVVFSGEADFNHTFLIWGARFVKTTFSAYAGFTHAAFFCEPDFAFTSFRGDTAFSYTRFLLGANFAFCTFGAPSGTDFMYACFADSVNFMRAVMEQPAHFEGIQFLEKTLFCSLWNIILQPIFRPIVRFLTIGRLDVREKGITNFPYLNTAVMLDGASNPYLKRYIDDEQWISSWRERGGRGKKALFLIWEGMSHCGRSMGLWAAWSLFFILLFSVIFTPAPRWWPECWWGFWREHGALFEQTAPSLQGQPVGFLSCLYFSIVNFTTLGFGDIVAINWQARILVAFEVVLGYVMLGGLISIFANKFARRS